MTLAKTANAAKASASLPPGPAFVTRRGDPLQLGIYKAPKEYIDPDTYSEARETEAYALSLLTAEGRKERDKFLDENKGMLTIDQIRDVMKSSLARDNSVPDPELMILLDSRTDIKIFIVDNTVYTRQELMENYPFEELGQVPEDWFSQQQIGVFKVPNKKYDATKDKLEDRFIIEYVAKDADDDSCDFILIQDLIKQQQHEKLGLPFSPTLPDRVVMTKVFVGKSSWEDLVLIFREARTTIKAKILAERQTKKTGQPNIYTLGIMGPPISAQLQSMGYDMSRLAIEQKPDGLN